MRDINNRIDWAAYDLRQAQIRTERNEKIAEIEQVQMELHNAHLGEDFSLSALVRAEELLGEFKSFLKKGER